MSDVNRLAFAVAAMLALSAAPAHAQTYAPAPRALTPVAPAAGDVCAPAPQGQGSASLQCGQECSRNPKYSPHCPQATAPVPAPNWGAPPAASPPPAMGAAPQAPGTPAQFGGSLAPGQPPARPDAMKEVRPSLPAVQNANAGAAKHERARPSTLPAPAAAPVKTRSGVDACQNAADVDGCRKQCAESLASSPMCPPPTTFDYCSVSPTAAVCQQFCQQMNGQYSPACPNAPKPQQTASQGGAVANGSAATASDLCAPPPQGKGAASAECKRACDRNPSYSTYCVRGATPPAGSGPVAGGTTPPASGGSAMPAVRGPTMAAAPAALAPQASSTLPGSQPPPRLSGVNAVAPINCGAYLAQGGEPRFDSIDGQPRGVVFTPGKSVTVKGCGFGERKGSVVLNGSSGGLSNLALLVQSWSDTAITVQVDPKLSGVMDQAGVEVVVSRSDGRRLQQTGHAFEAAREIVKLTSLPPGLLARTSAGAVRPQPEVTSPSKSGATLAAFTHYQASEQFCPTAASTDTLQTSKLPLKAGFTIDRFEARNLSRNKDYAGYEVRQQTDFVFRRQGSDLIVNPAWISVYAPRDIALGGYSFCWTSYEIDVYVKGPRGFAPL